jgi:hypothetical protein
MTAPQHLSWDNFKTTVFLHGEKRVHRVTDSPRIEVFGDGVANRIGILLEIPPNSAIPSELSKLEFIHTRVFSEKGRTLLEVATSAASLQRQFYHFAVAVAERVIVENLAAIEAVAVELKCFTDLLEERSLLGPERQIGLVGELLFLQRLVAQTGHEALDAWLGPSGEPHDFRLMMHEFEVKTTVSPHRVHTIHGTEQLVASEACSLYLVSIVLGPAGGDNGFSLADKVAELCKQFAPMPARAIQFASALEAYGLRPVDREHYGRRFAMRRPMAIVPVDDSFPAITRAEIQHMLGPLAARIESVQYDVNVEGLEREEGTADFETAFPH